MSAGGPVSASGRLNRFGVRFSAVALIFRREFLDYRRQRRVWRRLFLQPIVLMVLLAVPVLAFRAADARDQSQTFTVAVQGPVAMVTGLQEALGKAPLEFRSSRDAALAVITDKVDVAVIVPGRAASEARAGRTVELEVLSLPQKSRSRFGGEAVTRRLAEFRAAAAARSLESAGLAPEVAAPFSLNIVDLTSASGEGTRFGIAQGLPALLVIQLFGLMTAAEERLAGAKDRRVLEPLLVLPLRRLEILLGIGGATMTIGFAAAGLLFVPLVVGLTIAVAAVTSTVAGPLEVAGALMLGIALFGTFFTAIGLYAGARAHSGGEGSIFVTMAQLGVFAIVATTPFLIDIDAAGPVLLVPLLGPMLLVRDAVATGFQAGPTILTAAGCAAVCVLLVRRALSFVDAETSVLRAAR